MLDGVIVFAWSLQASFSQHVLVVFNRFFADGYGGDFIFRNGARFYFFDSYGLAVDDLFLPVEGTLKETCKISPSINVPLTEKTRLLIDIYRMMIL